MARVLDIAPSEAASEAYGVFGDAGATSIIHLLRVIELRAAA